MHTTPRPSLVSELAETLRRDLHAGEWRDFLPSERALCERLQISRPTLRKALTILSREGWLRAEHGLGWRIGQPPAASPVLRESRSVGLVCFVPLNEASSFSLFTIETLQEHLHRAGFDAHVHAGTQYASQNYRQALERLVRMDPSRGWVLIGGSRRIERWFVERKIPCFVTLTFRSATLQSPALTVDFDAVHRHAAPLLYERGHRRIALVFPRAIAEPGSTADTRKRRCSSALSGRTRHAPACRRRSRFIRGRRNRLRPPSARGCSRRPRRRRSWCCVRSTRCRC
jgi:DNA-binding LacI/PurR family transcriptional regulator